MTKAVRALGSSDSWVEALPGAALTVAERVFPSQFIDTTEEELVEQGLEVADVVETERPEGVKVVGSDLVDVDGVPTRTWLIENYEEGEVEGLRVAKVAEVKTFARQLIVSRYADWQQANMLRRSQQLFEKAVLGSALTEEEETERTEIRVACEWIDAVREASDAIEAAIPDDAAGIAAFDYAADPAWPA